MENYITTVDAEERAEQLENDLDTIFTDKHGLVLSGLNIDTMKPFEKGFFNDKHYLDYKGRSWDDYAEFIAYENVGMCTGGYLAAMIWKYRCTKDEKALEKAHDLFQAIKYLYRLSQTNGKGFYCKCYGEKISEQISSDQYIYTIVGLNEYMKFAPEPERKECTEMIAEMVRFWMNIDYTYPYFGTPLKWALERFPVFAWTAWQHTGEEEFKNEFERLCEIPEAMHKLPFASLRYNELIADAHSREAVYEFEKSSDLRLLKSCPETSQSGLLSLEMLLEYDAPFRDVWLEKVKALYDLNHRWIADDGLGIGTNLYNLKTGELKEVEKRLADGSGNGWKYFGLIAKIRSGMWAAMFARSAVATHTYFPELNALDLAQFILEKLDRRKLRWFVDMDGEQFPDDMKWMDRVYSGDAVIHWLWSYWEARTKYRK